MKPRYYVWVKQTDNPHQINFFCGKQFMANKVNAREYASMKGALIGLRAANRLLDALYGKIEAGSPWRGSYEAEAVMFEWSDSFGSYRPSMARTMGYC